jgi:hypothetical protein
MYLTNKRVTVLPHIKACVLYLPQITDLIMCFSRLIEVLYTTQITKRILQGLPKRMPEFQAPVA